MVGYTKVSRQPKSISPAYGNLSAGAQYLGVSIKQVRRLIAQGLPAYRFGNNGHLRVRFSELDRWLEENCVMTQELETIVDEIMEGMGGD